MNLQDYPNIKRTSAKRVY